MNYVQISPDYRAMICPKRIGPEARLALAVINAALVDCFVRVDGAEPDDVQAARAFLFADRGPWRQARLFWLAQLSDHPSDYDCWLQERLRALDQLTY